MGLTNALDGCRVLEVSGDAAVAYCTKVLGELGAEVIKVEPPTGDPLRRFGSAAPGQDSPLFIYANTGKRSVVADPTDPADATWAHLLDGADVVVSAESVDDLARRGTSPRRLADERGLVYISIRPYGNLGPDADKPGTELDVFHAGTEGSLLPGGLSYDLFPERPPVKAGRHLVDYDAGNVGALLALALHLRRRETGLGGYADLSKQDIAISQGRVTVDRQLNQGIRVNRADRGYDYGGILPCLEGYITVRPTQDVFWAALATAIGRPELIDDERFATRYGRERNASELDEIVLAWTRTRRAKDAYETIAPLGPPVGYYTNAEDLVTSEHAWTRGDLARVDNAGIDLVVPRPGYTFDLQPLPPPTAWPAAPEPDAPIDWTARPAEDRIPTQRAGDPAPLPLAGLKVLDLTWVAAGPYTTELLSMLGADVVKVESEAKPDLFRQVPEDESLGLNRSARFNSVNLNKQSIGINFSTPAGRTLLRRLAARADLLVSNSRPGALERLGLTYEDLKDVNPGLVVVCISSGGRGGTDPGYAGYASIFNSLGGLGHLTGYEDGPATEVRDSVDLRVGTVATVGALAALLARRRGDRGGAVDVSAQQAVTGLIGDSLVEYQLTGQVPTRRGNGLYDLWPYGVYACRGDDEWVAVAARDDRDRAAVAAVTGLSLDGREAADRAIGAWTRQRSATNVAAALRAAGVPASKVLGGDDLLDDPHLRARGLLRHIDHPTLGDQVVVGSPWRVDDEVGRTVAAPALGQDTEAVLAAWLGSTADEIAEFARASAIETAADLPSGAHA